MKSFFSFCFFMCLISCIQQDIDSQTYEKPVSVNIDAIDPGETLNYTDIFSSYSLVPLETKKECLIGRVDKIYATEDRIYVLDVLIAGSIFEFDAKGKFIKRFGNKGKGPGEYLRIIDFDIDETSNSLCLLDSRQKKVINYSINGDFISEFSYRDKGYPTRIRANNDLIYLDRSNSTNNLVDNYIIAYDRNGNEKNSFFPINKYGLNFKQSYRTSAGLSKSNDGLTFSTFLSNKIYRIHEKYIYKYITLLSQDSLDQGTINLLNSKNDDLLLEEALENSGKLNIMDYLESDNISIVLYRINQKSNYLFINRTNGRSEAANPIINDMLKIDHYHFISSKDDKILMPIQGENLVMFLTKAKKMEIKMKPSDYSKIRTLKYDSNPVIAIYQVSDSFLQ